MTARYQLIAYLATLAALVAIFAIAFIAGAISPDVLGKVEAFGMGTAIGGLIGVLRLPSQRGQTAEPHDDATAKANANDGGMT